MIKPQDIDLEGLSMFNQMRKHDGTRITLKTHFCFENDIKQFLADKLDNIQERLIETSEDGNICVNDALKIIYKEFTGK